jgi:hypothetical protein
MAVSIVIGCDRILWTGTRSRSAAARALFVRQVAVERDATHDRAAGAAGLVRELHVDLRERPALALRVHLQRDRGACAEARQQRDRRRRGVAAAERHRFVGAPLMHAVGEMDQIIDRADARFDGQFAHCNSRLG